MHKASTRYCGQQRRGKQRPLGKVEDIAAMTEGMTVGLVEMVPRARMAKH